MATLRAFRREHSKYLRANREEFVEHITSAIGEEYGLETSSTTIDPEGARTHLPRFDGWRLRFRPPPPMSDIPDATDTAGISIARSIDQRSTSDDDDSPAFENHHTDEIVKPPEE